MYPLARKFSNAMSRGIVCRSWTARRHLACDIKVQAVHSLSQQDARNNRCVALPRTPRAARQRGMAGARGCRAAGAATSVQSIPSTSMTAPTPVGAEDEFAN